MSYQQKMADILWAAYLENRPASYEDFETIGWSEEDFLLYVELCENVRASIITARAIDPNASRSKADNDSNNQHRTSKQKCKTSIDVIYQNKRLIVQNTIDNLLCWLDRILACDVPLEPKFNLHNLLSLGGYERYVKDDRYAWPTNVGSQLYRVYRAPEDFRYELEAWLYLILCNRELFVTRTEDIACTLAIAQKRLADVEREIARVEAAAPQDAPDFNSSFSMCTWAKKLGVHHNSLETLYDAASELEDYVEKVEHGTTFIPSAHILYVHKGTIRCQREHHQIRCVSGVIFNFQGHQVTMNINRCDQCNIFFVSYDEYMYYRNLYGPILCHIQPPPGESFGAYNTVLKDESPLMMCGYNVGQEDDLSATERQLILSEIIRNGILNKADVIRYLNTFIRINGARESMEIPVAKWTEDLAFVRSLNQPAQDLYYLTDIRRYPGMDALQKDTLNSPHRQAL